MKEFDESRPDLSDEVREQVELQIKYEGYIQKQQEQIEIMRKLENKQLPDDVDYFSVRGCVLKPLKSLINRNPKI